MSTAVNPILPHVASAYFGRLESVLTEEYLAAVFDLVDRQPNKQLVERCPVSLIPFAWIALAGWVSLTLNITISRIIVGTKTEIWRAP